MNKLQFPKDFLWGSATAGHQVEGNNINSESWVLEHLPETIYKESSGDGVDHYHHYKDDIELLSQLGFNSYRFSLEWARIEPEEGEFSKAALEHYRRVLNACHEKGIKPMVTLHHFTSPRWLQYKGGWLDKRTVDSFAHYTEKVSEELGELFHGVCTFNEPNISLIISKIIPFSIRETPFWQKAAQAFNVSAEKLGLWQFVSDPLMWDIIYDAHKKSRNILKSGPGQFPVGLSLALTDFSPVDGGEDMADKFKKELSIQYLERLTDDDFVGVQTYSKMNVGPKGFMKPEEGVPLNQMGEEIYPEALEGTIRDAHKWARIPIIVTENGLCTEDDTQRQDYIKRAVSCVHNCLNDGIDVKGYYCWSTFDNFEWISGYEPKFGIIGVDRETMERKPKPSSHFLGSVAKNNFLELTN